MTMSSGAATDEERRILLRDASGHILARAIHVAAELRLADRIGDGTADVARLASASGADQRALQRILHFLARYGYFTEEADGIFSVTRLGAMLRADAPSNSAAVLASLGHPGVWRAYGDLAATVRRGVTAGSGPASRPWERAPDADQARALADAMAGYHAGEPDLVAREWDFAGVGTVVDVGGSAGRLMTSILARHGQLRGIVFDRPSTGPQALATIEAAGHNDRCGFVGGSFFDAVPEGGDLYLLSHVLHDWSDEDAALILASCRRAMRPGAGLLIVEALIEPGGGNENHIPADLLLLATTEGRMRSAADYERMLEAAGFRMGRTLSFERTVSIIEARAG